MGGLGIVGMSTMLGNGWVGEAVQLPFVKKIMAFTIFYIIWL